MLGRGKKFPVYTPRVRLTCPIGKTGGPKAVRNQIRRQPCVNLCDVPDSAKNPERFAIILNEIIRITRLTEDEIGEVVGRHRSQINQWKLGHHLPRGAEVLIPFTDMLEADYQGPGRRLGTLPRDLLIAAGYGAFVTRGETPAAAETPARGFVVDLGDENERILWGLKAPRRVKEVMVAFWRMVKLPAGENAINSTFDEARQDRQNRHETRRRA